jgi:hypothetical protein
LIESIFFIALGVWMIRLGNNIRKECQTPPPRSTARTRRRDTIYKIGRN